MESFSTVSVNEYCSVVVLPIVLNHSLRPYALSPPPPHSHRMHAHTKAEPRDISGCLIAYLKSTGKCVLSSGVEGNCNVNMYAYKVSCCDSNAGPLVHRTQLGHNQNCETSKLNAMCMGGQNAGEPCPYGKKVTRTSASTRRTDVYTVACS